MGWRVAEGVRGIMFRSPILNAVMMIGRFAKVATYIRGVKVVRQFTIGVTIEWLEAPM